MQKPVVSVVTVADFDYRGDQGAKILQATLKALADQDFDGPVEILFCESAEQPSRVSAAIAKGIPGLEVLRFPVTSSYELMNAGANAARADIIAFLDADCTPYRTWVRSLVDSFRRHPEVVAVSGFTSYATNSFRDRVFALLSRSYVNPGGPYQTRFFSNNNGGMRHETWQRHPLPTDAGPYASRLQTEAIWRDGGRFLFDPRMRVVHGYEGWGMERDIRRHHGFATVSTRLRDREIPYARLINVGYAAIPLIVAGKAIASWGDCLRCARQYGVRIYELPAAMALSLVLHLMEIPGMVTAYRGRTIANTRYR